MLLALLAWRLLRHPDKNAHPGRMVIGWTALMLGALGIMHIALGSPAPSAGGKAMQGAGGLVGYVASAPLRALLTPWVAVPLLALVCAFGLLVVTGTPLHRVRERFDEIGFIWRQLRGPEIEEEFDAEDDAEGTEDDSQAPAPRGVGRRKSAAAIEAGENDRPYDTPLLGGLVPRGAGRTSPGRTGRDAGRGCCGRQAPGGHQRVRRRGADRGADVRRRASRPAGAARRPKLGPPGPGGVWGRGILAQVLVRRRR